VNLLWLDDLAEGIWAGVAVAAIACVGFVVYTAISVLIGVL
jgi:hypothetical protein